MKSSSFVTSFITFLILAAAALYFGFQGWHYLTAPDVTAPVYTYVSERTLTMNGFLVRDEEIIDCSETLLELTRVEGERVGKGKSVATVYQSAQALQAARELTELREQLTRLQYAKTAVSDTEAALRLDADIETDVITLRVAMENRNYSALEDSVSALQTAVLRREYAYRETGDIGSQIASLEERIAQASGSLTGTARSITAPFAGTYSAVTDGYESVLRPEDLENYTPASFNAVTPDGRSSTVGKLIRGERWYYAAVIDAADAALLDVGKQFQLAISGLDMPLPVRVSTVSHELDGKCFVAFQADEYLSYVTMLRSQSAELILESYQGLRVPKNAVRVNEEGVTGVYCRIGRQSYFKPVSVLFQGEDYCLVRPGEIEAHRDSDLVFFSLRPGDEVIISSNELFNGKVVN